MDNDLIKVQITNQRYGNYKATVFHEGLKEYKSLTSVDANELKLKIEYEVEKFNLKWSTYLESIENAKTLNRSRATAKKTKQKSKFEKEKALKVAAREKKIWTAKERSFIANENQIAIRKILKNSLFKDYSFDFEILKDKQQHKFEKPQIEGEFEINALKPPSKPQKPPYTAEPELEEFIPKLNTVQRILVSKKRKATILQDAERDYLDQKALWEFECQKIDEEFIEEQRRYKIEFQEFENLRNNIKLKWDEINNQKFEEWSSKVDEFYSNQLKQNNEIDLFKEKFNESDPEAVERYFSIVLEKSKFPFHFKKSIILEYVKESKLLKCNYRFPNKSDFPKVTEVKLVKEDFIEVTLTENQLDEVFEKALLEISFKCIIELFESDASDNLESIAFNGWINQINKTIGQFENVCILSFLLTKERYLGINFSEIDPKACFKSIKGVSASKLSHITPIQPIIELNKNDKRFTSEQKVIGSIDNRTNLASMDWEDFEHLIREIFAKEFSSNGGEVKVTQASRDGGVDAIAFDPDPIRGGKIVIQAKRYTATVGVSAVRDLFGTVMNEGANKGILVTTADYGSDAYEFIKGKPLTLMNGSNLLFLLEKHGHQAKIDLKEARETNPSPHKLH